ncbi:MAG: hypothetical protein ACO1NM_00090 [Sphingobium phenoxybenzoativorans]|uniref:hypothetical protein n=1 Tax=Sphingobium phenoxybenzoativorans TaxID=1592790 RepID=UPI0008733A8C|nr:hypothetical protein [Sphingobium phenoxybenzoativorans]
MADTAESTPKAPRKPRKPRTPKAATAAQAAAVKAAPVKKAATRKAAAPKTAAPRKPRATKARTAKASTAWKAQADQIKEQAAKTARSAAGSAKDKTGSAMQGLAKLIADTAGTVDAKLGPQYGDYARYAAEAVAGAAKSLDAKDVDQLVGEARDFVRKSPAVAIGAAAVVGFVLMRLAKGSGSDNA